MPRGDLGCVAWVGTIQQDVAQCRPDILGAIRKLCCHLSMCDTADVERAVLTSIFVVLVILDIMGMSWLFAVGGIGLAFAVVGHGGMWVPSVVIGVVVNACLIWLTVVVGRKIWTKP